MAETATKTETTTTAPPSAKKSKAEAKPKDAKDAKSKPRKPKSNPSHPKFAEMVTTAIEDMGEKGGSSLQSIKTYISKNYKVDLDRINIFIRRFLRTAVAKGTLEQTKGRGASGSFKLKTVVSSAPATARQRAVAAKPKPSIMARKTPKKLGSAKKVAAKKVTKPVAKKPVEKKVEEKVEEKASPKKPKVAAKPVKVAAKTKAKSATKKVGKKAKK